MISYEAPSPGATSCAPQLTPYSSQLTYLMFHYVTGTPFESSGGVYDRLTLWEQIDMGAHYTPAKKYYTVLPIGL